MRVEQVHNLFAQDAVELIGAHVLVAGHALLDAVDNFYRRIDAHVGVHQQRFKVVEHGLVYRAFAHYGFAKLVKEAGFSFLQAFVEGLLLLLVFLVFLKKIEEAHTDGKINGARGAC
jgi:hypothetical protein